MNRKKVAWLLTVAMVATSVDSSVLVASGADFSADTAEIVQDFSAEPAEASENAENTVETEVPADAAEIIADAGSSDAADLTEENQDFAFEDENGGLFESTDGVDGFISADVNDEEISLADDSESKTIDFITVDTPVLYRHTGIVDGVRIYDALKDLYVTVSYTDGTSEQLRYDFMLTDGTSIEATLPQVPEENYPYIPEGEYTIPISVGDKTAEVKLVVLSFDDYYNERATELTLDQQATTEIDKNNTSYGFKLTIPEDGIYTFNYHAEQDGEEIGYADYSVTYCDSEGNGINETSEAKKGDVIYAIMKSGDQTGYDFCITASKKEYILNEIKVVSNPSDTDYVEYLDYKEEYNALPKLEGLEIEASYSDGETETLKPGESSREGKLLSARIQVNSEWDEEAGTYVNNWYLYLTLGDVSTNIPVNATSIADYIASNSSAIEAVTADMEKDVEWNGAAGVLYSFTPSENGEYIFTTAGSVDTYGYIMDADGTIIAQDDDSGNNGNFKLVNKLEAGKLYYYIARPYSQAEASGTVKLYKKDNIKECVIQEPDRTTFLNVANNFSYEGLQVNITFESGKTATYTYGEEGFWENVSLSSDIEYDGQKMKAGNYVLTVFYDNEKVGEVPITVQSLADYVAQNDIPELTTEQDISQVYEKEDTMVYRFTAPESGKYIFRTEGKAENGDGIFGNVRENICDIDGNSLLETYYSWGTARVTLEKDKTYYFVGNVSDSTMETYTYTTSAVYCRDIKELSLSSNEIDLYEGIDDLSYSALYDAIHRVDVTLKFTDGTEEQLGWNQQTKEGYSCDIRDVPDLEDEDVTGEYEVTIYCEGITSTYTIRVHSFAEYMDQKSKEIKAGERTPVQVGVGNTEVYYAVAPETGYYKVDYLGTVKADVTYYDAQGNRSEQAIKVEKGQKFYFSLKNDQYRIAKALITVNTQESVLEKLTIKEKPARTSFIEKIDYIWEPEFDADLLEGLIVTAEYTDGTTEDLKYGDTDRYGMKFSANLCSTYDENDNATYSMAVIMGDIHAEEIPIDLIRFEDYLKEQGDDLETLPVNSPKKNVAIRGKGYQIFCFEPEKDDTYTFYSTGNMDTYGILFDENGNSLEENDDGGASRNFSIKYELKAGTKYYLGARAYSESGACTLVVADQEYQTEQPDTDDSLKLTDIQLVSAPYKTVFYNKNEVGELDTYSIPYEGLKISAKDENGKTVVYSYSRDSREFPFTVKPNIERDKNYNAAVGEYTAEVLLNGETVAEFPIEVKTFKDYLATITEVLNPGEKLDGKICESVGDLTFSYVKLPSDLQGIYWSDTSEKKWMPYAIYDSEGKRTQLGLDGVTELDLGGKDYYLCLWDMDEYEDGSFSYDKVPSYGVIKNISIVNQPEITEYIEGMDGKIRLFGMVIRIENEDGSEKTVPIEEYSDLYRRSYSILDENGYDVSEISDLEMGENNLTLVFGGAKAEFQLTVTDTTMKQADPLTLEKVSEFTTTESTKYHVYSYTPEETGRYHFYVNIKSANSKWWDEDTGWFVTDNKGNRWAEYNSFILNAGETYYFVSYCNSDILADLTVNLKKIDNSSWVEQAEILDVEAIPDKTEYTTKESVSYEDMKIHAIYEDGSEKDFTAEEAEEMGFEFQDNVRNYNGWNIPGNYEITVTYVDVDGYDIIKHVPITVTNEGIQALELSDQPVEVSTETDGKLYEYEVKESGYYQLELTVANGNDASFRMDGNSSGIYSEAGKTAVVYSSLTNLEKGKHYLYLDGNNGDGEKNGTCQVRLLSYDAIPTRVELVEGSVNTDFVYGQPISFRGAQFKVTFDDHTEKIVTIPENYSSYRTLETGLYLSNMYTNVGEHRIYAYIQNENADELRISIPYTVNYPEDAAALEEGKTYTITNEQLDKQSVIYTVTGSENETQIRTIEYNGANVKVLDANGNEVYTPELEDINASKCFFLTESGKTYYVVVSKTRYTDAKETFVKLSSSKTITGLTALPVENAIYYYGMDGDIRSYIDIELTYADGTTEVLKNTDARRYLADVKQERLTGSGTYSGILALGNLKTSYSYTVPELKATEVKVDELVEPGEDYPFARYKFVPEKTQRYYYHPVNAYDDANLTLRNAAGAKLSCWYVEGTSAEMVLTAGKTYYFDIYSYDLYDREFIISDKPTVEVDFANEISSYAYTGAEIKPEFTVLFEGKLLTEGKDYQVTYANNINAGTATAKFTPVSDEIRFAEKTVTFEILPITLEEAGAAIENIPDQIYTGKELTPEVKVIVSGKTLERNKDYEVSYRNNVEKGTAQVVIQGIGNYAGTLVKTFEIKAPAPITPEPTQPVTPEPTQPATPEPTQPATPSVTPEPSQPDTPSVTPEPGKPSTPSVTPAPATPTPVPTQAPKGNIGNAEITGIGDVVYTGKALTPAPTVTYGGKVLKAGTDYDVTYSGNVNLGTATLKITGKGSYIGTKTATFRICNKITYNLNKGTQNSSNKVTFCKEKVKLYNPTRKGYTFGGWYTDKKFKKKITSVSNKTTKNVTVYAKWIKVTKCSAPANVKLVNSKAKTMAISYQAVTGAKGYEISYATNAKFKGATKVLTKARSKTIKKLQKGKTYYVRVRAYKVDSTGNKVFGSYSKKVKLKITK